MATSFSSRMDALGMKFVPVPRGSYWMGERNNQRHMQITRDFYMGVYPVTQGQWQAIMGVNPSWFSRSSIGIENGLGPTLLLPWPNGYFSQSGAGTDNVKGISAAELKQFPVECVSWNDVQGFLKSLNKREGNSKLVYRLPTETEWEYACRGAATSQQACAFDFYFASPANNLSTDQADFNGSTSTGSASQGKKLNRPTKVGSYPPNCLGIYDMHGNVWEWCQDLYQSGSSARVIRGGSWFNLGSFCTAASRLGREPAERFNFLGFRLVADLSRE